MLTRRNEQGSQYSLHFCRQFMLSAAFKWNTIKIRISLKWKDGETKCSEDKCRLLQQFRKRFFFFTKKNYTGRCREVISAVGDAL